VETKYVTVTLPRKRGFIRLQHKQGAGMIALLAFLFALFGPAFVQADQLISSHSQEAEEAQVGVKRVTHEPVKLMPHEALVIESAVAEEQQRYTVFEVPTEENGFKSYMDYRTITDRTSEQYRLQQLAWTDKQGFRRYGDLYMIALGTYYSEQCGAVFRITLESGASFEAVVSDIKANVDTDHKNQHRNGNVVEFIVDSDQISRDCRLMGDMSWAGETFRGKISGIERLDP